MSSGHPETRRRIVDAATALLEANPDAPVSMAAVAAHAGVSRQALYLHFTDRTDLLQEVSRVLDANLRTAARQRRVDDAPTARAALREAVALQAWLKPQLKGVATALDVLRRQDPAADAAWKEREHARLQRCEQLVRRLQTEGDLAAGWDVSSAARCFWAVTSQRVWDDLAMDQGWSAAQYRKHLTALLEASLLRNEPTKDGSTTHRSTQEPPVVSRRVPRPAVESAGVVYDDHHCNLHLDNRGWCCSCQALFVRAEEQGIDVR